MNKKILKKCMKSSKTSILENDAITIFKKQTKKNNFIEIKNLSKFELLLIKRSYTIEL